MLVCTWCTRHNPDDARFCAGCGRALAAVFRSPPAAIEAASAGPEITMAPYIAAPAEKPARPAAKRNTIVMPLRVFSAFMLVSGALLLIRFFQHWDLAKYILLYPQTRPYVILPALWLPIGALGLPAANGRVMRGARAAAGAFLLGVTLWQIVDCVRWQLIGTSLAGGVVFAVPVLGELSWPAVLLDQILFMLPPLLTAGGWLLTALSAANPDGGRILLRRAGGGALLVVTLPCILRARFNLLSLGRMLPADTALLWLTAAAALAAGVLCLPRSRRLRTARRVAVGLALGFAAAAVLLAAIRTLTLYESPAAALSDAWYALAVDLPALSPAAALLAAAGGDPQPSVTVKGD